MLTPLCALAMQVAAAAAVQGAEIRGTVVGADDRPLGGARVVVACQPEVPWFEAGREVLADTRTDARGEFTFTLAADWLARQSYKQAEVFVLAPGHALETASWSVADLPVGRAARFELLEQAADGHTRLRVVDELGAPIGGAAVMPSLVADSERGRIEVPRCLWAGIEPRTDADGWVSLDFAREDLFGALVEAGAGPGVSFSLGWGSNEPFPETLELADAREWSVEVEGPPLPSDTRLFANFVMSGGAKGVFAQFAPPHLPVAAGLLRTSAAMEHAPFGLVSGGSDVLAYAAQAGGAPRTARFVHGADVYEVRIPIVDLASGAPVPGAALTVMSRSMGVVRTGEDGVAAFPCATPGGNVVFVRAPAGHLDAFFPDGLDFKRPEGGSSVCEVPAFGLLREARISGRVVDAGGRPVAGAWVTGEVSVERGQSTATVQVGAVADADGAFTLRGVAAGAKCEVTARLGDGEARTLASEGAPLELRLEALLAARGTLVDAAGRPIAGAEVEVWKASPPRLIGGERRVALGGAEHVVTDADGRFESPPVLRAGERYGLRWAGPTAAPGASDWLDAEAFAAPRTYEAVALLGRRGVLRDATGAPIAGARLRARRSGRVAETDAEGRFEFGGLSEEGDVVSVELADGARRGGVLRPAAEAEDWLLPRLDGEAQQAAPAPVPRARELELAHELLAGEFEAAVASGDESTILRAAQRYARVDPAAVLARVEEGLYETSWMRDFSLAYVGDALEERSPEEALAVTARLERGMSRALSTLDAARHLAPAAEREQLALVRADARTVTPPEYRVVVLARLAERLLELGEGGVAREVLGEAQGVAAGLPSEEWPGYARCVLGEVLATVDEAAGLALIDSLEPAGERGRHYGNVAHRIAAADPERAEELLRAIDALPGSSWRASRWRARVVYTMAPSDLARAERLAQDDRTGYCDGIIALALEELDPAAARAALARAFERALAVDARRLEWDDRASAVAALLPLAARLEPDRLRTWVERALALPRPPSFEGPPYDERGVVADATLAVYVAPYDRDLARALVAPCIAAYRALDEQARRGSDYGAVWAAAALVDPEWAAAEARGIGGAAIGLVGQVLALPPEERDAWVQAELVRLWRPGMKDI